MASTHLSRTSGSPTNALKFTYSFWVKLSALENDTFLLDFNTDGNNRSNIGFETASKQFIVYEKLSGSTHQIVATSRVFRDPSAWYHIVASCDKTLATAADRTKIYVNGVRETSFSQTTYPAQNTTGIINTAVNTLIGKYSQSGLYFDGLLSHVHFVDGTAYDASAFGSTDSTTGEWKINTSPSVTYGNNGFFILKDGNSVTDQSGNSNNFTLGGGTLTNTEDCPSNVFATMNSLLPSADALVNHANGMSNGNLYNGDQSPNNWNAIGATMGASTGKFYWEFKIEGVWGSTSNTSQRHGIANLNIRLNTNRSSQGDVAWTDDAMAIGWQNSNGIRYSNSVTSGYGTYVANDILMFAMDLDNLKLYVGKNGTWENSGVPTSGSTGTGAYTIPVAGIWCPYSETKYGSDKVSWNIGNGVFKATAISSEGTNASGIGKFEYDVPTGYTALSTKGLNL